MARAGDVVSGKYRLIHPLGIGGMGTVWRAEHVALKQQVALKLLHARGPQAQVTIKRFQREAQIAASIRHRNIVYISDFGTDGDEPYIVMELLVGVPLADRMVIGEPLSVTTFLHLVEETLLGLAAVHAAGVVHRDMKPENIFLVRESDGGMYPKLLDFGVSRSTERGQGHTITREGIVMGTPEYISPEQARGRMADLRSDIYSLGVVVYEALAGRLPFQADNSADLIVAVLNAQPLPLFTLRPELGRPLSDLIARAIQREPDQRFQNADEMRTAITALLEAQPELAGHALPKRFLAPTPPGDSAPPDPSLEHSDTAEIDRGDTMVMTVPKSRRFLLLAAGLAAVVGLTITLGGRGEGKGARGESTAIANASASAAPPPSAMQLELPPSAREVVVELFGVPADARVQVDGVQIEGSTMRFARDSGQHAIVVEAPGREPFRVQHDASNDGRYAVGLLPEKRANKPARPAPEKTKKGLLRRPDF
jgi:serine/threonine protein kinase